MCVCWIEDTGADSRWFYTSLLTLTRYSIEVSQLRVCNVEVVSNAYVVWLPTTIRETTFLNSQLYGPIALNSRCAQAAVSFQKKKKIYRGKFMSIREDWIISVILPPLTRNYLLKCSYSFWRLWCYFFVSVPLLSVFHDAIKWFFRFTI